MGKTLATLLLAAGLGGCSLSSKLPATDTADLTQGKNLVYVMPRTKQEGIRASYFDPNVGENGADIHDIYLEKTLEEGRTVQINGNPVPRALIFQGKYFIPRSNHTEIIRADEIQTSSDQIYALINVVNKESGVVQINRDKNPTTSTIVYGNNPGEVSIEDNGILVTLSSGKRKIIHPALTMGGENVYLSQTRDSVVDGDTPLRALQKAFASVVTNLRTERIFRGEEVTNINLADIIQYRPVLIDGIVDIPEKKKE